MIGNCIGLKWTAEQDALLVQCFSDGMSAARTAARINSVFKTHYSRNAIIGRAARRKIASANPPHGRASGFDKPKSIIVKLPSKRSAPPKLSPEIALMRCAEVDPLHIDLMALNEGTCHWPYGDGPFTFCGRPILDGSYCFEHQQLSVGHGTSAERTASNVLRWGARR